MDLCLTDICLILLFPCLSLYMFIPLQNKFIYFILYKSIGNYTTGKNA